MLVDGSGREVNPCAVYVRLGVACPSFVTLKQGTVPILPLAALLESAGISMAFSPPPPST